jgi:hypothetical protein
VKPRLGPFARLALMAVAAAALVPLLGVDPGVLAVLLDADFVVLAGLVGLTMVGAGARVLVSTIIGSLPMLWIRVGVSLTTSHPGTLVAP